MHGLTNLKILQQFDGGAINVNKKALVTQLGTTTCNRLMVVPRRLREKHWTLSVAQQPAIG